MNDQPKFYVVSGAAVDAVLSLDKEKIIQIIAKTYLDHENNLTNNPDSYFLKFEDKPEARIIALPSAIRSDVEVSGIKWIGSYPKNIERNLQRASAVLLLNDYQTGYPMACLEAPQISSARTAASAALTAKTVMKNFNAIERLSVVGAGLIARTTLTYLKAAGCSPKHIGIYDQDENSAILLADFARNSIGCGARIYADLTSTVQSGQIVVLATTAAEPYILPKDTFRAGQLVLNISLRDLSPEIILSSFNVFDDVEHCMKANTSPHLAEQLVGNRDFADATIGEILLGSKDVPDDKPVVFSPFGLGVLDLAVGHHVLEKAIQNGPAIEIDNFMPSMTRW